MASERTSGGDPARTLELLWRARSSTPRRGPRPGLSIDAVVSTATRLGDEEGLDAVTMRRVAAHLGVSPMTLYTYVPGKAELLDLMLDDAYRGMPRGDSCGKPWRRRLTEVAEENRALYLAHPWATDVSTVRPPLGPGLMAKYEHELSALEDMDLDDITRDSALAYLLGFVQSCARASLDVAANQAGSMDDEQWWARNAPLLERVFDARVFPTAARVGAAAGAAYGAAYDPDHAYRFGLARVLDGLAALVAGSTR